MLLSYWYSFLQPLQLSLNKITRACCLIVIQRAKLLKTLKLALNPDSYQPRLVYDLDSQLLDPEETKNIRMIDKESLTEHLKDLHFESRFESGNLRRVFQVYVNAILYSVPFGLYDYLISFFKQLSRTEYDLVLNADVNSSSRQQWFYFRISGGFKSSDTYTFNVINMEKEHSLFNDG